MAGPRPNVFLIGPMGAGKSAVGKLLARTTGREFHDSDAEVEARTGVSIVDIFEHEGEAGFRRRERSVVEQLTKLSDIVLATGGGAVLDADNRRVLGTRGLVVYLRVPPEVQWKHVRWDRSRPLLHDVDPEGTLRRLFEERDPLYRELCDYRLDMGQDGTMAETAQKIAQWLDSGMS